MSESISESSRVVYTSCEGFQVAPILDITRETCAPSRFSSDAGAVSDAVSTPASSPASSPAPNKKTTKRSDYKTFSDDEKRAYKIEQSEGVERRARAAWSIAAAYVDGVPLPGEYGEGVELTYEEKSARKEAYDRENSRKDERDKLLIELENEKKIVEKYKQHEELVDKLAKGKAKDTTLQDELSKALENKKFIAEKIINIDSQKH